MFFLFFRVAERNRQTYSTTMLDKVLFFTSERDKHPHHVSWLKNFKSEGFQHILMYGKFQGRQFILAQCQPIPSPEETMVFPNRLGLARLMGKLSHTLLLTQMLKEFEIFSEDPNSDIAIREEPGTLMHALVEYYNNWKSTSCVQYPKWNIELWRMEPSLLEKPKRKESNNEVPEQKNKESNDKVASRFPKRQKKTSQGLASLVHEAAIGKAAN